MKKVQVSKILINFNIFLSAQRQNRVYKAKNKEVSKESKSGLKYEDCYI